MSRKDRVLVLRGVVVSGVDVLGSGVSGVAGGSVLVKIAVVMRSPAVFSHPPACASLYPVPLHSCKNIRRSASPDAAVLVHFLAFQLLELLVSDALEVRQSLCSCTGYHCDCSHEFAMSWVENVLILRGVGVSGVVDSSVRQNRRREEVAVHVTQTFRSSRVYVTLMWRPWNTMMALSD
jgi:hypothetical protein